MIAAAEGTDTTPVRAPAGSWIDRLTSRIDDLPGPAAAYYLAFSAIAFLLITVSQWWAGGIPVGYLSPVHLGMAVGLGFGPWQIGYFNRAARKAVRALPAGRLRDPAMAATLERGLTTLPSGPALALPLLAGAVSAARVLLLPNGVVAFDALPTGASVVTMAVVLFPFSMVVAVYTMKVLVQSWAIRRLLTDAVTVSVLDIGPIYAFSRLTAMMSVSIVGWIVALSLIRPLQASSGPVVFIGNWSDPWSVLGGVLGLATAGLAFVLPLTGAHGRLADDKSRLLTNNAAQVVAVSESLYEAIAAKDVARMDQLAPVLGALEAEQRLISGRPTWPWQPETFRLVAGALMFPVAIFVIQQAVTRLLP